MADQTAAWPNPAPSHSPTPLSDGVALQDLWTFDGSPRLEAQPVNITQSPSQIAALLRQTDGMTRALSKRLDAQIGLDVLATLDEGKRLIRKIRLHHGSPTRALALALIVIEIEHFTPAEADLIRQGEIPFGTLLESFGYSSSSHPHGFFTTPAAPTLRRLLALGPAQTALFGRLNDIKGPRNTPLASVLEILSPTL